MQSPTTCEDALIAHQFVPELETTAAEIALKSSHWAGQLCAHSICIVLVLRQFWGNIEGTRMRYSSLAKVHLNCAVWSLLL